MDIIASASSLEQAASSNCWTGSKHLTGEQLLAQALAYRQRGWSIVPIAREKKPGVKWSQFQSEVPNEAQLHEWFVDRRFPGMAVIFGNVSGGLACRDFDTMPSYTAWAEAHPDLAKILPSVRTARGMHVYFRAEREGFESYDDGEYRADAGHYCVLPPSVHPDGTRYTWLVPLPQGELPVLDPHRAGLRACNTEDTEYPKQSPVSSALSAPSVLHEDHEELNLPAAVDHGEVHESIRETLPPASGQRHRAIFNLARKLKAIPGLSAIDGSELYPVIRLWHQNALAVIGTKPFEETLYDFLYAWDHVEKVAGKGPIDEAFIRANTREFPLVASKFDDPRVKLLISFCRELQLLSGDKTFFLGCRTAGSLLGVDHTTASRWLLMLCKMKVLKLDKLGTKQSKKSSTYFYLGD